MKYFRVAFIALLFYSSSNSNAQEIDLLLAGGNVIDPKNEINEVLDVAIKDGKIVQIGKNIKADNAKVTIDAKGLYVSPGIIDIHAHVFHGTVPNAYLSNSFSSLPPDGFTFRVGVTTIVDAGGAGWRNFRTFKDQTIDRSKTRVLGFLNIVGSGMSGGAYEQNMDDMNSKLTAMVAKQFKNDIVGIKLAHYSGPEWFPTEQAVEAGRLADVPVMVDFGGHEPELSLESLFMEKLRPGDIFTHCYGHVNGRIPIVNDDGKLEGFALKAQQRGIVFDVGHGGGSFRYDQAVPAIAQGLKPNSISTDLHTGSMNGGMKDMLNVMSKFLNLGLTLEEVIEASTWSPAQIIQREELGSLSEGGIADLAVFSIEEGAYGFVDVTKKRMSGDQKLVCELTIKDGKVVWDLNGISSEPFVK